MSNRENLTGKTFGYLTVLEYYETKSGRAYWLCKCKCGELTNASTCSLKSGKVTSCGCRRYESKNYTHNHRHSRIYSIWCEMKKRCYNSNSKSFHRYGGRGIVMCQEWKDDFSSFYNWSIKSGYAENLTIDRIDVNGNYCPDNCQWISHEAQQQNKTNTILLMHNGESYSLRKWCKILNIPFGRAYSRYMRLKDSGCEITYDSIFLYTPQKQRKRVEQLTLNGEHVKTYDSINQVQNYGYNRISVLNCCNGKQKTSGGYLWRLSE